MRRFRTNERGANLVEFALLAPLLILLVFGIIEFAWVFSLNLDIRHGAREAGRMAATDDLPAPELNSICSRMDIANDPQTQVSITTSGTDIGDDITVVVQSPPRTLTGLLDWAIPSSTILNSTIVVRQEQHPNWTPIGALTACP